MAGGSGDGGLGSGGAAGAFAGGAADAGEAGEAGGGSASGGAAAGGGGVAGGGGGGATVATKPSAGCAKGNGRPADGAVSVKDEHYFTFPESYDGKKPFPVLFGFHGCGAGNRGTSKDDTEWMSLTHDTRFATDYVRATPISSSPEGCWTYASDIARVIKAYDELLANHCVDTNRVFATGHSSGAEFVVQLLTTENQADAQHLDFKAVAPIAGYDFGALRGPIPVMYIQGIMDTVQGGDGHETVAHFRAANACSDSGSSKPYAQVMGCQSGTTSVNPGCIVYDGCQAPTIWCSHNDPAYSGTMHGVPCFGVQAAYDFFQSQP